MSELGDALPLTRNSSGERVANKTSVGIAAPEHSPAAETGEARRKRPWYFSTTVIAIAYFVFSPLGSLLILTDRRRSKKAKIRAVGVLLFSLTLLTYRLAFMPPTHF